MCISAIGTLESTSSMHGTPQRSIVADGSLKPQVTSVGQRNPPERIMACVSCWRSTRSWPNCRPSPALHFSTASSDFGSDVAFAMISTKSSSTWSPRYELTVTR